jgi:two-component system, response regulator PdtaR
MERKTRVLVVEDEALTALMLCRELSNVGYEAVNNASSAEDAVRCAEEISPDFIFMDIRLTGIKDGIDAAEKILNRCRIPIAFMTGYYNTEIKDRAMKLHPVAFLNKPLIIENLKSIIDKETQRG